MTRQTDRRTWFCTFSWIIFILIGATFDVSDDSGLTTTIESLPLSISHNTPRCSTLPSCLFRVKFKMALHRLSMLPSAVNLALRRNIGLSAVLLNPAKELDPVQKLFLDKIRDYNTKSKASGGVVDAGPAYQKNLSEEVSKLERLYGGGDLSKFPDFKFQDPKLDEVAK
ncbi:ATP synthase-coupling factor 6, mitochondrial [Syngnathoides biaculeatus]|uniref:ATP synthase-coupling factor 6, mitochondrial n=1 Tax=Syngnathoides biaculeatus TaxID=300417 RepID=UPI002ADE4713|nr:ATP synthase-coupling factor 6, mitochondrial [Syngnathoides biaculeatus]